MKIAVISDIHGNYPAFRSVLDDADENGVEQYIFIGDYIFDMPFSNEVVKAIMGLKDAYVIAGNKERYLNWLKNSLQTDWTYKQMGAVYQTYRELEIEVLEYLMNLPNEKYIKLPSGKVIYASHYFYNIPIQSKMKSSSMLFYKKMIENAFTHEEYLKDFEKLLEDEYFSDEINKITSDIVLFGHNHLQGYGYYKNKLVVNPGSCGCQLDFQSNAPYTIIIENENGFNVEERRVSYDIEEMITTAKKSEIYKCAEIWLELCFLCIRTGRDYFGVFFDIANKIAEQKNESYEFYSNETWEAANFEFWNMQKNM